MTVSRRCGCLDEHGRQYGKLCPKLTDPKHGMWCYRFSAGMVTDQKTGKPRRQQIGQGGFKTKKAALDAEAAERDKVARGAYVKPSSQTLGPYAIDWLERRRVT